MEGGGKRTAPEVVSIDVTLRIMMPEGNERQRTTNYDLVGGQVPPDLRSFARKKPAAQSPSEPVVAPAPPSEPRAASPISSVETREVLSVRGETPVQARAGSATSSIPVVLDKTQGPPLGDPSDSGELPVFPPGTKLGTFEVHSTLGQGGMGVVYKAYDASLDRHVALKVLSSELNRNKNFIERFRREAKACGKLSHPNITHIYSISPRDERWHHFAMEYVEGRNLAEWVRDEGVFPLERIVEIARQASRGLEVAAKAKIIHRDIKPSNLLLTADKRVKITDFGLAKARASMGATLDLTSTGVVMGTPLYMSPEQARGGKVDHRSDMYSLGATLYFLATGQPPFEADSAIAIILKHINEPLAFPSDKEVPQGLQVLIRRLMEKDASRRPETYAELIEDLDRLERGEAPSGDDAQRVIVINRKRRGTGAVARPDGTKKRKKSGIFSGAGLKATKLSVARTNIKLGRRSKAVSLLLETIEEADPPLRAEAALILMSLYEKDGDEASVHRMAATIMAQPADEIDPAARAYAGWQLARQAERAAQAQVRTALERYQEILQSPPDGLPPNVIEEQIRRLQEQLQDADRAVNSTQVVLGSNRH
jgi:serine/threonine protein kinase